MGAKNHVVVMPNASGNATVNALVAASFGAAGQRCMALSSVVLLGAMLLYSNCCGGDSCSCGHEGCGDDGCD